MVFMKAWELLFRAWGGKGGVVGIFPPFPHTSGLLLEFGDPYVAIICARDFFSADSSEFDEGAEGVSVGDGALCVGASSAEDIIDTSS